MLSSAISIVRLADHRPVENLHQLRGRVDGPLGHRTDAPGNHSVEPCAPSVGLGGQALCCVVLLSHPTPPTISLVFPCGAPFSTAPPSLPLPPGNSCGRRNAGFARRGRTSTAATDRRSEHGPFSLSDSAQKFDDSGPCLAAKGHAITPRGAAKVEAAGIDREAAILFVDIRGFTRLSRDQAGLRCCSHSQ